MRWRRGETEALLRHLDLAKICPEFPDDPRQEIWLPSFRRRQPVWEEFAPGQCGAFQKAKGLIRAVAWAAGFRPERPMLLDVKRVSSRKLDRIVNGTAQQPKLVGGPSSLLQ